MQLPILHISGGAPLPWRVRRVLSALILATMAAGLPVFAAGDAAFPAASPLASAPIAAAVQRPLRARFGQETASTPVRQLADWIVDSGDNQAMPFVLVDKTTARVYVFHADGRLRAAAPALLGMAVGDDAVPGIGQRKLSSISPHERTTPAGRFVASLDRNLRGSEILWVDYEGAVSLHPVVAGTPQEQRAQRLSSPTPQDNRISYGCINVPLVFFTNVVKPAFTGTSGVVYVLPETRPASQVFASYDVDSRAVAMSGQPDTTAQATSGTLASDAAR